MCCKSFILPASTEMVAMLLQVGFAPVGNAWFRQVEDAKVTASFEQHEKESRLVFSLSPNITSMEGHVPAATAASLAFKVGNAIAERFEAALIHDSNISLCKEERGGAQGLLAAYPDIPFRFDALCLGFRNVLGGERT